VQLVNISSYNTVTRTILPTARMYLKGESLGGISPLWLAFSLVCWILYCRGSQYINETYHQNGVDYSRNKKCYRPSL